MENKFIEFDKTLINAKYIGKISKFKGANAYSGKFGISAVMDGFENLYEWFDTEYDQELRYHELFHLLTDEN
jgi:hypothetical protein